MAKSNTRSGPRDAQERRQRARELARLQQQRDRRRRMIWAGAAVAVVVVAVAVIVALKLTQNQGSAKVNGASTALVGKVTSVPSSVLNSIGAGTATALTPIPPPRPHHPSVTPRPLTNGGKPEVVYIGEESCPYCAGERWAIVNALSRFGTWSGLGQTMSSSTDVYPDTHSFTFRNAHLSSPYIALSTTEMDNRLDQPLQTPGKLQLSLAEKLYGSQWGFPFVDIANLYALDGTQYPVSLLTPLSKLNWTQIAADMHNAKSAVAGAIDGEANTLTAGICKVDGGKPANVCTVPGVVAAMHNLKGS